MKSKLLDSLSENFMILIPLLQKKVYDSISEDELPPIKLSPATARVLVLLYEMRCATVSEIGQQVNISRPNMTPLMDKLVRLGLAERNIDEGDRRIVWMRITDEGDKLCVAYKQVISGKIKSMLSHLDEEDLDQLLEHLSRIKEILLKA